MFLFAYDGSINGDWVSHYAVQLAAAHRDRTLTLVHVRTGRRIDATLAEKLQRMRAECERCDVRLDVHLLPPAGGNLVDAIRSAVPEGPEHYLVCGTRAQGGRRGLLSGTVSEQLLRSGLCNVLAVRVVQPGLLGSPRRLLLPVAARAGGFRSGLPFLRLFGPQVSHLHIVLVARVGRGRFRQMSHALAEGLRSPGQAYCERVEHEIVEQLGLGSKVMDAQVVLSDEIPGEILVAANKTKSRLIYMGASQRKPTERFFHGNPIERVLRDATCDVAIYRGVA
jgi:nucleotide-binding universal stress UspA family protein